MTLMERRRALMGKEEEISRLVSGNNYGMSANTLASVDENGHIVIGGKWGAGWSNRIQIPFTKPLTVKSGDTVRAVIDRVSVSGSPVGNTTLQLNSLVLFQNHSTKFYHSPIKDVTVTAASDLSLKYLAWENVSVTITASFIMSLKIYINGKVVLR